MIVCVYSKLVQIKPIWGNEDGQKDAQALKEFLDSDYGKNVRVCLPDRQWIKLQDRPLP